MKSLKRSSISNLIRASQNLSKFHTRTLHQASRRLKTRQKSEIFISDAQHKPRLSGMSFGLLISELNSKNLTSAAKEFRNQGAIPDSERATLRKLAVWILGVPAAVVGIAGGVACFSMGGSKGSALKDSDVG